MPLSATQQKRLIVKELNQSSNDDLIEMVSDWWEIHDDKDLINVNLRRLYVKFEALQYLISKYAEEVDIEENQTREDLSDIVENYRKLFDVVKAEIKKIEDRVKGGRTPLCSELTNRVGIKGITGARDPNSRSYRGDPVKRWPDIVQNDE
jgi:hypothetical protein